MVQNWMSTVSSFRESQIKAQQRYRSDHILHLDFMIMPCNASWHFKLEPMYDLKWTHGICNDWNAICSEENECDAWLGPKTTIKVWYARTK